MPKDNKKQQYVAGIDAGGTKTTVVLSDLKGKIIYKLKTGPSHPRNLGLEKTAENVVFLIRNILKFVKNRGKVRAVFLALPAIEEELKDKKNIIKKEILKHKDVYSALGGKLIIDSDQLAGFKSGTDEKDGLVLIAGSGCACHGWKGARETKIDGWGCLSEMGSAFFVGQESLKAVFKSLDGRSKKTLLAKLILEELKVKGKKDLVNFIYSKSPIEKILSLSICCNLAAERGDKTAKKILASAGQELALSAKTAIKDLQFAKLKFPLVLIGSMFNSRILLDIVKKEIKAFAPKVDFIRPIKEPAVGAAKLAIESLANKNDR